MVVRARSIGVRVGDRSINEIMRMNKEICTYVVTYIKYYQK